jgi:MFS family permease
MAPPIGEGAAMGLLAASSAIATLSGTILTGPLVEVFGYRLIPPIAIIGLLSAVVLMGRPRVIAEAAGGVTVQASLNPAEAPDPVPVPPPVRFPDSALNPRE